MNFSGNKFIPIIFIIFSTTVTLCDSLECISDNTHKVRQFQNLTEYKNNSLTFNPEKINEGFEGNIVYFNTSNIGELNSNAFLAKDSNYISELNLESKNIKLIADGAFSSLHCLFTLTLRNNKISYITRSTFKELLHLKELNLNNNKLVEIRSETFMTLTLLKILDLSENKIKYLSSKSFLNLRRLEKLLLNDNELENIDSETFTDLINLNQLNLERNHFLAIEPENWKNLIHLKTLNLSNNVLKFFEVARNYSFNNLEVLLLNGNQLTHLNIYALREAFPNLTTFKIDNNKWNCEDVQDFVTALSHTKIDYSGNTHKTENRKGISCVKVINPSSTTETIKWFNLPTQRTRTTPTQHPAILKNQQLHDEINSLKFAVTCLTVLLLSLIVFEVVIRCGVTERLTRIFGRHDNYPYIDDSYSEHFQLTRN